MATVQAGAVRDALTVPDAAILHDAENVAFVYLQTGGNKFARRVVKVADSYQGRTRVESGLQEGDKVVGDGKFVLGIKNSLYICRNHRGTSDSQWLRKDWKC